MPLVLPAPLPSYRTPSTFYRSESLTPSSLPSSPSPLAASFPSSAFQPSPRTDGSSSPQLSPLPPHSAYSSSSVCSTSMSSLSPTYSEGDRTDSTRLQSSRAVSEDGRNSPGGRPADGGLENSGEGIEGESDEELLRRLDSIGRWDEQDESSDAEGQGSGNVSSVHKEEDDSLAHQTLVYQSAPSASGSSSPFQVSRTTPSSPTASHHQSASFFRGTSQRVLITRTTILSTVSLASHSESGVLPKEELGLQFLPQGGSIGLEVGEEEVVESKDEGRLERASATILTATPVEPAASASASPSKQRPLHSRRASQSFFSPQKTFHPFPSVDQHHELASISFSASSRRHRIQSSTPQYTRSPVYSDAQPQSRASEIPYDIQADGNRGKSLTGKRKLKSTPSSRVNLSSFFTSPFSPTINLPSDSPALSSNDQRPPFSYSPSASGPSTPVDEKGPSELYHSHQHIVPRSVTNALTSPIYPFAHLLTFLLISLTAVFAFSGVLLGSYSLRFAESVSRRVAIKAGVARPPLPPLPRVLKTKIVKKRRGVVESVVEKGKDAAEGVVNVVRESAVDWVRRSFPEKVAGLMVVQGAGTVGAAGGVAGKRKEFRLGTLSSSTRAELLMPTVDLEDDPIDVGTDDIVRDDSCSPTSTAISSSISSSSSKISSRRNSRSSTRPAAFSSSRQQQNEQPPRPPLTLLLASIVLTIMIAGIAVVLSFFKPREPAVPEKRRRRESSGEKSGDQ